MVSTFKLFGVCLLLSQLALCQRAVPERRSIPAASAPASVVAAANQGQSREGVRGRVIEDAIEQTQVTTIYDPSYVKLEYPNGDVPLERGVCADVIVRAFRKGGVDLQKEVHEDIKSNFSAYPQRWGLTGPDPNIDHRRVANLMVFFKRRGTELPSTTNANDYKAGDVVVWELGHDHPHIGIVTDVLAPGTDRYQVVHNIGAGAKLEDVLFLWPIIGHYRYFQ